MASEDQGSASRFAGITSAEELLVIQRKEKKDLIAKTQKMKHGVPKGDKKKKKEVTAEIAQLLADLDLKHEAEMKEFEDLKEKPETAEEEPKELKEGSTADSSEGGPEHPDQAVEESSLAKNDTNVKPTQRVSKAQKRRNKKAALAKERDKAIAEQEVENLSGLRHLESEAIKKKLLERNLTIFEIPSDGNCLYKAIEHQLSVLNLPVKTVQTLRDETSSYMLSHTEDYLPFLSCPETGDGFSREMYKKYCEDIAKTAAWGGHVEIQVLSVILGYPIEIIQAEGPNIVVGDQTISPKLTLSYHRHVFGLGEHYNSVIPVSG